MIRGLIIGVLHDAPVVRRGTAGKDFTTAKLKADSPDGMIWCNVIAFGDEAAMLSELKAGASLSVAGRVKPTAWLKGNEARAGLDVVADGILPMRPKPKP